MEIFKIMKEKKQEQIAFYTDKSVKLRAILAIHSTELGPALGGIRILKYQSADEALTDLIRISQAMTYKNAAAGLNLGGGQVVIIEQDGMEKGEPLFRAVGRFIESFKGRFISGGDMGVTEEYMEYIAMETHYVTNLPEYCGGSGNQSRMCAEGVFTGLVAAAQYRWGTDDIAGKRILIHGYGKVGSRLAASLKDKGAEVLVADIDPGKVEAARAAGFEIIDLEKMFSVKVDIFSPCAIGSIITPGAAEKINCKIVAGAANNQLQGNQEDQILKKRDILYVPDFIINSGAVIDAAEEYWGSVSPEYQGYKRERVTRKVGQIKERLIEILTEADKKDITPNQAAHDYAEKRIDAIKNLKGMHLGKGRI